MFFENGFENLPNFATTDEIDSLKTAVSKLTQPTRSGGIRSIENLSSTVKQYSESDKVLNLVSSLIGGTPQLARAIYFNKTQQQNWLVAWHQDKTTAVSNQIDCDLWSNWSVKDSIVHAQPPQEAFNKMLTIRLHLDKTDQSNGCLKVIPKSHSLGVLKQSNILSNVNKEQITYITANAGDAVIMHPLIIHASSKAKGPSNRRIIHMEYSSFELPNRVKWA